MEHFRPSKGGSKLSVRARIIWHFAAGSHAQLNHNWQTAIVCWALEPQPCGARRRAGICGVAAPRRYHHIACVAAPCICLPGARAKMQLILARTLSTLVHKFGNAFCHAATGGAVLPSSSFGFRVARSSLVNRHSNGVVMLSYYHWNAKRRSRPPKPSCNSWQFVFVAPEASDAEYRV